MKIMPAKFRDQIHSCVFSVYLSLVRQPQFFKNYFFFVFKNYLTELKKCQLTLEEALSAKSELEVELQELDAQHETAMAKVIAMRDEALEKLKAVVSRVFV